MLRFLQGLKWDYQKTFAEIVEHAKWHKTLNLDLEQFRADLELGVIYGVRRDINMRPVIIVNIRRMVDSQIPVDRLIAVTTFFLEYVIAYAMVPGSIESWTCIFDLKDVGLTEIPKDRIQPLVNHMTKNYRGRLFRFYATDVTFVVRQLWKLAHRFVDEFTNKKLLIYGDDYHDEIKEDMMAKLSLKDALLRYGDKLVIAATGAIAKKGKSVDDEVRVIYDGTNGDPLNHGIQIRDHARFPKAPDVKCVLAESADERVPHRCLDLMSTKPTGGRSLTRRSGAGRHAR